MKTITQSFNGIQKQESCKELVFHLDHQDLTKYTQLFYAVKNVENAMRLFVYENLNYFKNHQYFEHVCRFLKIKSLKSQLEEEPPSLNIELSITIDFHLRYLRNEIWRLKNETEVREQIEDIWYLIYQAYNELDRSNLRIDNKYLDSEQEKFEDFLKLQTR